MDFLFSGSFWDFPVPKSHFEAQQAPIIGESFLFFAEKFAEFLTQRLEN
jgi:hypothetical protein